MEAPVDIAVGTIFAGRYRVARRIAAGGMGAVFEVVHVETERKRALKVMHAHLFQSEELRERFKREAKVAAHVDSEFIVDVSDAGVDEATGMPFFVMEFLRGEELGERIKREGKLLAAEALLYLHQTALALDKTHRASIVHRDLKPANIFLTERDEGGHRVKILDFGIAKVVAEGATTGAATQALGTPLYMAPEQFNPSAKLNAAADIYALGMLAYTMLVGAPYWADESRGGNIYALVAVAIQGPREAATIRAAKRGALLPPAFDAWFARATACSPEARFQRATEAVQALAMALEVSMPRVSFSSFSGESSASAKTAAGFSMDLAPTAMLTPPGGTLVLDASSGEMESKAGASERLASEVTGRAVSGPVPEPLPTRAARTRWPLLVAPLLVAGTLGIAAALWGSSKRSVIESSPSAEMITEQAPSPPPESPSPPPVVSASAEVFPILSASPEETTPAPTPPMSASAAPSATSTPSATVLPRKAPVPDDFL